MARQGLRPALGALLALCGLGFPSAAAAAPGESPCDRYGDRLDDDEIARLGRQISLMAPARYAKVAQSIRIVNVEAGPAAELGPFAEPGDGKTPPTISVPTGFRRLQCRLIQVGFYYLINYFRRDVPLAPPMRDCMAEKADLRACIDEVGTRLVARAERDPQGRFNPEMTDYIRRTVDAGFLQVLLHEFAHIAYGHFDRRPGSAAAARAEAEADAYSLLRIVIGGKSPLGAFWTYSGMSIGDPYLDEEGGAHGRSACRAAIANDILSLLTNVANDAYYWSMDPPAAYLERRAGSRGARVVRLFNLGEPAGCPSGETPQVLAVERDLQALATLLDRLAGANGAPADQAAAFQAVLELPLASEEARTLRMSVMSLELREWMRDDDSPESRRSQRALVERMLAGREALSMTSEDYGRLEAGAAIAAHEAGPAGSSIDALDAVLRRRLEKALYHHPDLGFAHLAAALLAYRGGRCAEGRSHLDRNVALADNPAATRSEIAPLLEVETLRGCAGARDYARGLVRTGRDWR